MTFEELESAILDGDAERCAVLLDTAGEPERRAVAARLLRLEKDSVAFDTTRIPDREAAYRRRRALQIALLGTATLSELRKTGNACPSDFTHRILAARRPAWLAQWADWALERRSTEWAAIRRMVREGLIPRPQTDWYYLRMVDTWAQRDRNLRPRFDEDPELLEYELWRLFEIEGNSVCSLAIYGKCSLTLLDLERDGKLPRGRLLDATLEALSRDFAEFRAGWFSRFHEDLKPSVEERAARKERYLGLLGSRIPPTVSFALKALTVLDKAGHVTCADVERWLEPALHAREKGSVLSALKLIANAAKREPRRAGALCELVRHALEHAGSEVREKARELLAKLGESVEEPGPVEAPAVARPVVPEIREPFRSLAGIDEAMRAFDAAQLPAALTLGPDTPRLHERIRPVETLEELIDTLAGVIENEGPPEEIERALDGVSRLCADRPEDFERRAKPLLKRARVRAAPLWSKSGSPMDALSMLGPLAALAITWIAGELAEPAVVRKKNTELHERIRPVETLEELIDTLAGVIENEGPPEEIERVLEGVSRLCADRPEDFERRAKPLLERARVHAAVLSSKSGSPMGAPSVLGPLSPLAIAWIRGLAEPVVVRNEGREFMVGRIREVARRAAKREARPLLAMPTRRGGWIEDSVLEARLAAPGPFDAFDLEQANLRRRSPNAEKPPPESASIAELRWAATFSPGSRTKWFETGIGKMRANLDWWSAQWENRSFLEVLLDPDEDCGPLAAELLALALGAKEPGERSLGTDLAIAAIGDGRLSSAVLGDALAVCWRGGKMKAPRWAKALKEVARAGDLQTAVVVESLQRFSVLFPDIGDLLELLNELSAAAGMGAPPDLRRQLEAVTGTGKAAKSAKALLAFEPSSSILKAASAQALQGRIERAARWAARPYLR